MSVCERVCESKHSLGISFKKITHHFDYAFVTLAEEILKLD